MFNISSLVISPSRFISYKLNAHSNRSVIVPLANTERPTTKIFQVRVMLQHVEMIFQVMVMLHHVEMVFQVRVMLHHVEKVFKVRVMLHHVEMVFQVRVMM
jgi:hypothetical protein